MSHIIAGNGGRGGAVTAITVALILMASSPAILTTEAFAAPKDNKYCKDVQFRTLQSSSSYIDNVITIGTSQDEYSVDIDYYVDTGGFEQDPYFKNVAADEPTGDVLLPGGETITITLRSTEDSSVGFFGTYALYDNRKVSDCEILLGLANDKDKVDFEFVDVQQIDDFTFQLTFRVPDASEIDKHFTKLGIDFASTPESSEYYLISDRVLVS
jgi:hypothetical protein